MPKTPACGRTGQTYCIALDGQTVLSQRVDFAVRRQHFAARPRFLEVHVRIHTGEKLKTWKLRLAARRRANRLFSRTIPDSGIFHPQWKRC